VRSAVRRFLACFLVASAAVAAPDSPASAQTRQPSVLFLVGYRSENPAGFAYGPKLQRELSAALGSEIDPFTEYLDPARVPAAGFPEAFETYLRAKYAERRLDLIVASDRTAMAFLERSRDRAFPGVPVVFFSTERATTTLTRAWGFGVHPDFKASIETALAVQPETREVLVIVGASAWDKRLDAALRTQLAPLRDRVAISFLDPPPMAELLARLAALERGTIVYLVSFAEDGSGQRFTTAEMVERVTSASAVPVYSWNTAVMGQGILGGRMISLDAVGRELTALGVRVLRGEGGSGPMPEPDLVVTEFDWRQMRRWGISESSLPAGSTILNREPASWRRYVGLIVLTLGVLTLQATLIAGLLVQRARRRRIETALRESERRFRLMADSAPVLVWMAGTDRQCTFFNSRWLEFTGRSLQQELGEGWTAGVHPDDLDECVRAYSTAFDARRQFSIEYRLRRADGAYRWILDTGVPMFDASHRFTGYIGSCVDFTERRDVEEALRRSSERYRLATAAGAVGVWDWNADTRQLYVDPQLKQMLGFADAEIPNRVSAVMAHVHPDDLETLRSQLQACLEGRTSEYRLEHRMLHKDGTIRWVQAQGSVVRRPTGEASRFVGTASDVTERKQAEILVRENEAILEASHREIQALAGRLIVAQEAERTRIARDLHDDVSQELAGLAIALSKLKRAGGESQGELTLLQLRAMTVAENVRTLSHDLHPSILRHAGLVAALTGYCDDLRRVNALRVTLHAEGDCADIAEPAALCLYRVAQEALRNVVTHAEAKSVEVRLERGPGGVNLSITDDGRGFDVKARENGRGLGLISIGERVRLAGGTVSVVTQVGKGTRLHVRVPEVEAEEAGVQPFHVA
jgi:PAS domain S-box-containing protein